MVLALGLLVALTVNAQLVQDNEMAVVYYLPQTQLWIDVEYEQIVQQRGIFAEYAHKYLAADDIIEADSTFYRLRKISCGTRTVADQSRAYKVVAEKGIPTQLLTLTPKGILYGYNVEYEAETKPKTNTTTSTTTSTTTDLGVMPLLEEQIVGKSEAEMAAGAAKQIYRIRETRMYILGGEVDHAPADGNAMKRVLDELDKQERQLIELFIGKEQVTKKLKTLYYTPVKTEEVAVAHFSIEKGLGKTGAPILLSIAAKRQLKAATTTVAGKNSPVPSQIYYNIPGSAEVNISCDGQEYASRSLAIAQFGVAVPLARELFTDSELPHIHFDPLTGNIQSITK